MFGRSSLSFSSLVSFSFHQIMLLTFIFLQYFSSLPSLSIILVCPYNKSKRKPDNKRQCLGESCRKSKPKPHIKRQCLGESCCSFIVRTKHLFVFNLFCQSLYCSLLILSIISHPSPFIRRSQGQIKRGNVWETLDVFILSIVYIAWCFLSYLLLPR